MSRSERKVLMAIAMSDGVYMTIKADYDRRGSKARQIHTQLDRLHEACTMALSVCVGELGIKEIPALTETMQRVERACLNPGESQDVCIMTSLCIGMMDDILEKIASGRKKEHLEYLLKCLERVHRYFDHTGRRWSDYERAGSALTTWHQLMDAA